MIEFIIFYLIGMIIGFAWPMIGCFVAEKMEDKGIPCWRRAIAGAAIAVFGIIASVFIVYAIANLIYGCTK